MRVQALADVEANRVVGLEGGDIQRVFLGQTDSSREQRAEHADTPIGCIFSKCDRTAATRFPRLMVRVIGFVGHNTADHLCGLQVGVVGQSLSQSIHHIAREVVDPLAVARVLRLEKRLQFTEQGVDVFVNNDGIVESE
ncbi:hypothetical protein NG895_02020 [Aeoliella sp. ICT_H6.2]|uniref:Uncharacterized protein n=1 Tax=Aeoliella straminimaris TaxID=2954799 RepID=A0A9X2JEY3_9BACT|nr:hypothetical protein [Aeoliella straminimaris]MCO6042672.1 hypothetical protein [Aeoliella straminimaris]